MAWTTPATYTTGQIVTAANLNEQLRDNSQWLYDNKITVGAATYRMTHTYAIAGEVRAESGDNDYIAAFFVPELPAGVTATLKGIYGRISSGTSVTAQLLRRAHGGAGEAALSSPYNSFSITATGDNANPTEVTGDVSLASKDRLRPKVTGVSGTPYNLTLSLIIEYTR